MPTPVIVILVVLTVLSLIGSIVCEMLNKICIFIMCAVFIVTALVLNEQLTAPFLTGNNLNWLIYVIIFMGVGVLFASPFFIPGIEKNTFSFGSLIIEETDFRAGIGFCAFGGIAGALISGPCIAKFLGGSSIFFFILPAIIIGLISFIYTLILIIGTVRRW